MSVNTNTNMYIYTYTYKHTDKHTYMRRSGGRGGRRCEVTVGIGHVRHWCKVMTTKKIFKVRFEKAQSGVPRRKTRASTGQEQEQETVRSREEKLYKTAQ